MKTRIVFLATMAVASIGAFSACESGDGVEQEEGEMSEDTDETSCGSDGESTGEDDVDGCSDDAEFAAGPIPSHKLYPPDPPCPVCTLSGDVLNGRLNDIYDGEVITEITLRLIKRTSTTDIDLTGLFSLQTGSTSSVRIPGYSLATFDGTAQIVVAFKGYDKPAANAVRID